MPHAFSMCCCSHIQGSLFVRLMIIDWSAKILLKLFLRSDFLLDPECSANASCAALMKTGTWTAKKHACGHSKLGPSQSLIDSPLYLTFRVGSTPPKIRPPRFDSLGWVLLPYIPSSQKMKKIKFQRREWRHPKIHETPNSL